MLHIHRKKSLGRFNEVRYCEGCGKVWWKPEEYYKSELMAICTKNSHPIFTDHEMAIIEDLARTAKAKLAKLES